MSKIICKSCNCIIVEDSDKIDKNLRWIQCPNCLRITGNPIYEKDDKDK